MIKVSAPGKLMLMGEHAVVYGQPCIVTAVNRRMMVELETKFKAECQPGTQIVSNAFPLPNSKPVKVVEEKGTGKIYFYIL